LAFGLPFVCLACRHDLGHGHVSSRGAYLSEVAQTADVG
jgi:hypothetical protein